MATIQEGVHKLLCSQRDRDHDTILDWLTPIDYSLQQSDFINRRQEGTGQWLLDSEEFNGWLSQTNHTLYCRGMPGAGKTIVTSIVVQHLLAKLDNDPTIGIAYIYCSYKRQQEQTPRDLLLSLLKQFLKTQPLIPERVRKLYKRHEKERTSPSFNDISETLQSVVAEYTRALIIVDALDECQFSSLDRKKFLSEIFNIQAKTGANLFITSRFIPAIEREFEGSMSVEIRASGDDVRRYLEGHMLELPSCVLCRPDLQKEIIAHIIRAVDGMCVY
jgi:hypothetical protein